MSITVNRLAKVFGNQRAVDNISFSVKKGEILGFLGPNGAGKSTTMKIATCYLPPTEGTVEISGIDVTENPVEVRRIIGYLPEHNPLYLDMYVHEYLGFIGSLYGKKGGKLKERIKEMISLCGLTVEQNKKIGSLSKGYRQRVGLAQALLHDPEVIILDEPTTGLDPNQIVEIRSLIKSVSKEKTVIFSTHIMQEVQALCDRVVIINLGKIVADSPVEDLKRANTSFNVITVEFSEAMNLEDLQSIEGVREVREEGKGKYLLHTDPLRDVRGDISRLAYEKNKMLIGLKQEENSLEKIFQNLTKKQEP